MVHHLQSMKKFKITVFPVFERWKVSEHLTVKYFPTNTFSKERYQASEEAVGYDFFASEAMTLLPKSQQCVKLI